jgi:hypothetical protein
MSDLQILFPDPVAVELSGKLVLIHPVRLRHFEQYGKTAAALIELFANASVQQINLYAATNSGRVRQLLLQTTSLTRWQLWRMPASVSVQILAEVVRVNAGFFGEALPAMARALSGPTLPSN